MRTMARRCSVLWVSLYDQIRIKADRFELVVITSLPDDGEEAGYRCGFIVMLEVNIDVFGSDELK